MTTYDFPEQRYVRRCIACPFVAPHREEWDESPAPEFCPRDGLPLERIACPNCGAPVMWQAKFDQRTMVYYNERCEFCPFCGGPTELIERKMIDKPKPPRIDGTIEPEARKRKER